MPWKYLSHPINPQTPLYAGETGQLAIREKSSIEKGDSCNSLTLSLPNHLGTHFDFPRHFCSEGKTLSDFDPGTFVFNQVGLLSCEVAESSLIDFEMLRNSLARVAKDIELLMLHTGFSRHRQTSAYWQQGPGLGLGLADGLRRSFSNLRAVGIDLISASSFQHRQVGRQVHKEFLCHQDRPLLIIEDMNFDEIVGSRLGKVIALPLHLDGADGAPATILAEVLK